MGLLDKLKNALFEEEYVEVEEKPKTKESNKVRAKDLIKDKLKEEKPVAKKIVLPEKKETRVPDVEDVFSDDDEEDTFSDDTLPETIEEESAREVVSRQVIEDKPNNFKVIEEKDLVVEQYEPKIVKVIDDYPTRETREGIYQSKEEKPTYQTQSNLYSAGERVNQPYGVYETPRSTVNEYSGYEGRREEKSFFKPSPIISPIYGILDKNYRKEDVVTKKEVRLVSSYAKDKLSVDDVRKKAFENTAEPVKEEEDKSKFEVEENDNLLVDLTTDEDKPAVKEVTMGDAVEYFEDLGLEYNVDYMDASKQPPKKEQKTYKVSEADIEDVSVLGTKPVAQDDDNLFDLIDSMYQEQE